MGPIKLASVTACWSPISGPVWVVIDFVIETFESWFELDAPETLGTHFVPVTGTVQGVASLLQLENAAIQGRTSATSKKCLG
jgi:hypothetical protein